MNNMNQRSRKDILENFSSVSEKKCQASKCKVFHRKESFAQKQHAGNAIIFIMYFITSKETTLKSCALKKIKMLKVNAKLILFYYNLLFTSRG